MPPKKKTIPPNVKATNNPDLPGKIFVLPLSLPMQSRKKAFKYDTNKTHPLLSAAINLM